MSRIGKKPIFIPDKVIVQEKGGIVSVNGPRGVLIKKMPPGITLEIKEGSVFVIPDLKNKNSSALWGLARSLVANMISGVTGGFEKKLEFEGVGYRASLEGDMLVMQLGFSHPVRFKTPGGIKFSVEKNLITVSGTDKELVGQIAARVRSWKPPEPYKGKGIRYQGEVIRRKAGKKAVAVGA